MGLFLVSLLISALVKRFSVSRMRDFFFFFCSISAKINRKYPFMTQHWPQISYLGCQAGIYKIIRIAIFFRIRAFNTWSYLGAMYFFLAQAEFQVWKLCAWKCVQNSKSVHDIDEVEKKCKKNIYIYIHLV